MLRGACGAEEEHTNNTIAPGMWAGCTGVTIYTVSANTGNAAFRFTWSLRGGGSPQSAKTGAAKCWWSFAGIPWMRNNGTYLFLFRLLADSTVDPGAKQRFIGWYYNAGDSKYYLRLFTTGGDTLATSTNGTAVEFRRFKIEFDNDEWTLWSDISGAWQEEFTYSDDTTPDYLFNMDIAAATDATKSSADPIVDDCCFWDEDGDNWNTRGPIDTYANSFPRISAAHVPAAGRESDAGQGVKLDEIPPDAVDKATIDETDYYVQVTALLEAPEDLTAETIQALLVTHVAGDFNDDSWEMRKFNVKRSGTLYADSEEEGIRVQVGVCGAGAEKWWQYAGYYPWTPEDENWTEVIFNACDYGISLIDDETDQMTVQVIFFGTSHEWEPAAAANIKKLATIEWASVKKVGTIAEASISKVSTISAN